MRRGPFLAELQVALQEAIEGADRVASVVESVRLFGREDRGAIGPTQLNRVVEAAVRMAWPQIGRQARLKTEMGAVPLVMANEPRLAQVMLKLLVRASRSIPEGNPQHNEIRVRTGADASGQSVWVQVLDTGRGMSDDALARAFDPNTCDEGAQGLSLFQALVTSMGGSLEISNNEGKGSVIKLVFPAVRAEIQSA